LRYWVWALASGWLFVRDAIGSGFLRHKHETSSTATTALKAKKSYTRTTRCPTSFKALSWNGRSKIGKSLIIAASAMRPLDLIKVYLEGPIEI
jgi:hypothetical protein